MDVKTLGSFSVIGIALLISLGYNLQPSDNYFSASLNMAMHCDRLSASGNRCYPTAGTTKGYKDSPDGWIPIDRTTTTIEQFPQSKGSYIYEGPDRYFKLIDEPGKCLKNGLISQKVDCP